MTSPPRLAQLGAKFIHGHVKTENTVVVLDAGFIRDFFTFDQQEFVNRHGDLKIPEIDLIYACLFQKKITVADTLYYIQKSLLFNSLVDNDVKGFNQYLFFTQC